MSGSGSTSTLETARQQIAAGKHRKAIDGLYHPAAYPASAADARAIVELVSSAREQTDGRLRKRYDDVLGIARAGLARRELAERQQAADARTIARVQNCRVLGGHGTPPRTGESWELVFTAEALHLLKLDADETVVPYEDVTAFEIGGRGAQSTGGGFIGGGFGVQGAAEGMLIASALNLMSRRTTVDTVICIQTNTAELFLHHDRATPNALRMLLSPVFTILRQQPPAPSEIPAIATVQADPIDRLAKLAELLDRGMITDEEFRKLKADIVS
jgi:hypothetical protein